MKSRLQKLLVRCLPMVMIASGARAHNAKKSFIETNPAEQPASPPQKTAAQLKAEQDALTKEISPEAPEVNAGEGFDDLCANPKLTAQKKALMGCSGQNGSADDQWCNDPRATEAEKASLGCLGYGKSNNPDPYAPTNPTTGSDGWDSGSSLGGMIPSHVNSPDW